MDASANSVTPMKHALSAELIAERAAGENQPAEEHAHASITHWTSVMVAWRSV
jgi:hypothetical protein